MYMVMIDINCTNNICSRFAPEIKNPMIRPYREEVEGIPGPKVFFSMSMQHVITLKFDDEIEPLKYEGFSM
mgnify:FL=1